MKKLYKVILSNLIGMISALSAVLTASIAFAGVKEDTVPQHLWDLPWADLGFAAIVTTVSGLVGQVIVLLKGKSSWRSMISAAIGGGTIGVVAVAWMLADNWLPLSVFWGMVLAGVFGGKAVEIGFDKLPHIFDIVLGRFGLQKSSRVRGSERDRENSHLNQYDNRPK